jgi:hypothetical protein
LLAEIPVRISTGARPASAGSIPSSCLADRHESDQTSIRPEFFDRVHVSKETCFERSRRAQRDRISGEVPDQCAKMGIGSLPAHGASAIISRFRGSGFRLVHGSVAQLVEQRTFNPLVASSNLARPTRIAKATRPRGFFHARHRPCPCDRLTKIVTSCPVRAGGRPPVLTAGRL